MRQQYGYTDYRGDSLIFHETGLVTFPLLGSLAPISTKLAFDPKREKRARLLPVLREIFSEHTVYYGGSSSFDFCDPRFDKHTAVMRFAAENGYQKEEILFVGDDFGDGGGDCHVRLGGLDYIEIADYRLLGERLAPLL